MPANSTAKPFDAELRQIEIGLSLLDHGRSDAKYLVKVEQDSTGAEIVHLTTLTTSHDGKELRAEHCCRRWRVPLASVSVSEQEKAAGRLMEISGAERKLNDDQMESFGTLFYAATDRIGMSEIKWNFAFERDEQGYEVIHSSSTRLDIRTLEVIRTESTLRRLWKCGYSDG